MTAPVTHAAKNPAVLFRGAKGVRVERVMCSRRRLSLGLRRSFLGELECCLEVEEEFRRGLVLLLELEFRRGEGDAARESDSEAAEL